MKLNDTTAKGVKVGDEVCFKIDVEQYSEVYEIRTVRGKTEFRVNVTEGEYTRGMQWIDATRCFVN